jgi:hypothetical protein
VFVLRTQNAVLTELRMHPTEIEHFHARLADRHAPEIANSMAQRCAALGTRAVWDDDEGCLVVRLRD